MQPVKRFHEHHIIPFMISAKGDVSFSGGLPVSYYTNSPFLRFIAITKEAVASSWLEYNW